MAEPVVVASYQSTVLDEPEPGQGMRKRSDTGSKSPGKTSRRWGKGALFKRSSSDQELNPKQPSAKGKAKKEASPAVSDAQGDAHLESSMDIGSRPTGPDATIVGVEWEDGEKGKPGDAKKLLKQNKDLVKQIAQLNKTVDTLRHEKESLSVEKNKLKSDLKSAEKELKKVSSSLSSSKSEVERLRHQHKQPKQSTGAAAEEVAELQKRVWQLEAQLTERNEKLASLRHRLGVQVERLESGNIHSSDAEDALTDRDQKTTQHTGSLESMLQLEKEANARLRKENSELQSRVTSLEGDLDQLQQQQKDEEKLRKKGKLFKKTSSTSSLREHVMEGVIPTTFSADTIAGSDAYAELSARFSRQESPFSSPRNSPRLRRKNHMSFDGPTLQSCLKLSLEEKKVLEQEKEGLKMDLKNVRAQLTQLQETHSCEKKDLMEQLEKACMERDKVTERLELQCNGTVSGQKDVEWAEMKEALEEENRRLKKDLEEARQRSQQQSGSSPPTVQQKRSPQTIHRRSASTTSEISSERKPATKRLSWSSEPKDWRERKNSDSSAPIPERAVNGLTSTEDSKASAAEYGTEDKRRNGNGRSGKLLNSDETKDSPTRRRAQAQKGCSKENFAAARAKFLSNAGTSQSEPSIQKEHSNSVTSTSESVPTSTPSNATSGGSPARRRPSLESRSQSTVVLGKPPIHPSTTNAPARHQSHDEGSNTPPPTTSKAAALAKRMSSKVAERRKSFEEQPGNLPIQSFQSHHTRTASFPAMSKLSTSRSVSEETETESPEQRSSVEAEEKKAWEKKAEKERKWEEERRRQLEKKEEEEREKRRKKEMEEKRKQELEEKRKRELEEKERVRKEKEEKERQRKEMEEKRKQELEERRKREQEEKERVKKQKEEKERQRKEMEEKRKREQEEKKRRELEEKERLKKEKEEKERQRQLEEKRRQEQERERELQRQREAEQERERQREKEARLRELEQREKQEQKKMEEQRKEEEKEDIKYPSGSVAQRRQAFERNSPSSSPPVVLRKKIPGSPAQRPKSMDFSALQSVQVFNSSPTALSPSPQNGSPKQTSISVKVSKSPQTSPLLNQRKEIKEVPVQKTITKPNAPATAGGRTGTVSIVTTSSSPPLRRAHTLSSSPAMFSSLASSTPDLTSVGSSNGSSSPVREVQVSGWSPGSQRKTNPTTFRHSPLSQRRETPANTPPTEVRPPATEQRNAPRSPLTEKRITKSVSFSPVVSTADGGVSITKPSPPTMSFKASPAKLMIPGAADMKKAASLQDIPEHAPAHNVSPAPTFTVGAPVAPRVNRRPRSERPNTTSLSRADTVNLVNLISQMQGREKAKNQVNNKGVSDGSSPTPQGGVTPSGRPASMYGSINPSRMEANARSSSSQKPKPHERKLQRRSTVAAGLDRTSKKSLLLRWCQVITNDYDNIYIEDFSKSFSSGLAFCAMMHHFMPDKIPYSTLDATNRERNFRLAFEAAEEAGIPSLLDIEDMVSLPVPDWMSVMTYVSFIYNRFGQSGQQKPTLL